MLNIYWDPLLEKDTVQNCLCLNAKIACDPAFYGTCGKSVHHVIPLASYQGTFPHC